MRKFLSVYTATHKRPQLLGRCMASVLGQSMACEHVVVHDFVGLGVEGMYGDIENHADQCHGEYVLMLNDDDYLLGQDAIFDLWTKNHGSGAEVLVFQGDLLGETYPRVWEEKPSIGDIAICNYAMRNDIWRKHATHWKRSYEADYWMFELFWELRYRFNWIPQMVFKVDQVGRGVPELESAAS